MYNVYGLNSLWPVIAYLKDADYLQKVKKTQFISS